MAYSRLCYSIRVQKLRLLTAGESHGDALTAILEGLPAGIPLDMPKLQRELSRRRILYGRSSRQETEHDDFTLLSGAHEGYTTGNPLSFLIPNAQPPTNDKSPAPITIPRPGHADLAGALKFAEENDGKLCPADIRLVSERASARETVCRVLAGAVCKSLLSQVGVSITSFVYSIGNANLSSAEIMSLLNETSPDAPPLQAAETSPLRIPRDTLCNKAKAEIDAAKAQGMTLGGGFAVMAFGALPGLGGYAQWNERLDGRIAQALMSIPAVKDAGIGCARWLEGADSRAWHDEIARAGNGVTHITNHAGGVTGGMTNGMPIVATAIVKPIPTQNPGLRSIDLAKGEAAQAPFSRCDTTAVPAAAVVGEAMLALVLADAALAEFGGSHVSSFVSQWNRRKKLLESLFS